MISRKFQNPFHELSATRRNLRSIASGRRRRLLPVVLGLLLACLSVPVATPPSQAQSAEQSERELQELRSRIQTLQRQLERQTRRRDSLAGELREAETTAGTLARQLEATGAELAEARTRAQALARDRDAAARRSASARESLAEQLRQGWQGGRGERLRLLLNQDDPSRLGRMLVYHDYLSRERTVRLQALLAELAELRRLGEEAAVVEQRLQSLATRQRSELADLERARGERAALLARVEAELTGAGGELAQLRRQEEALTELIERLRRELAGFPSDPQTPFASLRGNLAWPAPGPARHGFGDARADGSVRWNGVLLGAPPGTPVRAIHHGRVVYADWLPGMGLLLVIDHGAGYMSLYGHNQSLLREVGDWVAPGESIATVGDSGGQSQAGLYFEIRQAGRPVNPGPWMRGPPPSPR